jgi:AbrB family looped-hinge helix DNA binding protein
MNIGTIVTPNAKGQIVIPKSFREELDITPQTYIQVQLVENTLYLKPIAAVIPRGIGEKSYYEILKRTKGAWAKEDWDSLQNRRKKVELTAARERRKGWSS